MYLVSYVGSYVANVFVILGCYRALVGI